MTYGEFITKIRRKVGDLEKVQKDVFDGDGASTIFPLSSIPIKDASYVVKVGGTIKTEVTDYTLDKDTGLLTFTSAPASGSDNIEVTYRSYKLRDVQYLDYINDAIDHFQWKFWKEEINTTSITTTKGQYEYDLSSLTGILYLVNAWYKNSADSSDWINIHGITNWKYLVQQKKLVVNPPFTESSLPLKLYYLRSLTKGTSTSSTIDIPNEWLVPFEYFVIARYIENLAFQRINEIGSITNHPFFLAAPNTINLAENYYRKADLEANKIAPKLPPMTIKQQLDGLIV